MPTRNEPTETTFDLVAFGEAVRQVREAYGMSLRAAALDMNVGTATLHRVEAGHSLSLSTAVIVANWAGLDLNDYVLLEVPA
jgi:transcriptional regulator with XRE-family HTH domain